jgi:DNA-binding SARP family transcriptional activator
MITGFYLLSYNYWMGEIGTAASIRMEIEAMAGSRHASPLARLTGCFALSWHGWMEGNHKTSLKAITDGLEISRQSGVVLWNYLLILQGAANTLSQGDADGADNWLEKLAGNLSKARGMDLFYYYHERGWQALLRERMQEALAHQQTALAHAEKVGCLPVLGQAHYGMSQICHENGLISERNHHLSECRRLGDLCQSRLLDFLFYLGEAHYALDDDDEESVRSHLEKAMNRGAAQFFCNVTFWRSSVMTRLCLRALQEGIEVEYVQQLITKRELQPLTPPLDLDTWPWRLLIYTFGTFAVVKDGQPLIFGKKAQAKILELLKALIAFGGKEVSEARLSEALWPDSDGDSAHQALATALFRLRKWLGVRDAIIRSAGKISLDPNLCWIDCWAFERLLEQSAQADDNFQYLTTKATKIYQGHFLSTDTDKPWATLMREHLRGKMVRSIQTMADTLAAGDHYHYQEIISWYRHGIEIDPLAEEFYQGLMLCYYRAGEIGQAMRVYKDLKKVLVAAFAIKPSRKSQEIYRKLR